MVLPERQRGGEQSSEGVGHSGGLGRNTKSGLTGCLTLCECGKQCFQADGTMISTGKSERKGSAVDIEDFEESNGAEGVPVSRALSKQISVGENNQPYIVDTSEVCDACPECDDTCDVEGCRSCSLKRRDIEADSLGGRVRTFTLCQVRRHNTLGSCWLVANGCVFDVTEFLPEHFAGIKPILKHAGGRDCTEDFLFHSKKAQALWNKYKIGRLRTCGESDASCTIS